MRLFIAINLPEEIALQVDELVHKIDKKINRKPAGFRWLPQGNWHFTITFLGYEPAESLDLVQKSMEEVRGELNAAPVEFEKIIYGPPAKMSRMIWLTTSQKTVKALSEIKNKLESRLEKNGIRSRKEMREFNAHLTLARFSPTPLDNLPPIEEKLNLNFFADSLHLMKSILKLSGAEYEKIFQIDF